ncbi:DUF5819 family protein [Streptomyces sp. NPDC005435]|uniref:DUF5819 family protein n=1 Tax=Streptomyces sp. NPDC005435 TaxID=3154464 RepID=UPI00345542AA
MDAYDEDSGAPRGPDGPSGPPGARRAGAPEPDDGPAGERADGQVDGRPSRDDETGAGEAAGSVTARSEGAESRAASGGDAVSGGARGDAARSKTSQPGTSHSQISHSETSHSETSHSETPHPDSPHPRPEGRHHAPPTDAPSGVAALSPAYRVAAAVALGIVAVVVCVHLGMVFLSLAPANTVSKQHGKAVEAWVYPEFEQNWKLFAPNPLQQNIAVQARAELRTEDGGVRTTGWIDLSAEDGDAIDHNPVPSHTQQNELRRAWDFLVATHNADSRPVGTRGALSEAYVRRIVVMRLGREADVRNEGVVQRVQVRSETVNVPPPPWSAERISTRPVYRELPWWTVPAGDITGGVR